MTVKSFKEAVRNPYAWPGGYPTYIVLSDGEGLCIKCARKEATRIMRSIKHKQGDGWRAVAQDINYESDIVCCHCGEQIESAYGVPEEKEDA